MPNPRGPGVLRRLAALLIRGPEAAFILTDLDDTMERERARGIPLWRARWRYAINMFGSAFSVWRTRGLRPNLGVYWLDVKLGLRMLAKQPGLTVVAVFALAIGIPVGLVPAHFVNAIQAPLPFDAGDRIRLLRNYNVATSRWEHAALYDFTRWRDELTTFDALGATTMRASYNLVSDDGRAAPVAAAVVTASTFDILRVRPQLGRALIAADEVVGAPDVVVIGHDLWQSRLEGDPDVVGRTLRIGADQHTVVGVMPQGFLFPFRDQLWLPLRLDVLTDVHGQAGRSHAVFGRLADGVSSEEAEAELATVGLRLAAEFPDTHTWLQPETVDFAVGFFGLPKGGFESMPEFYLVQVLTLLLLVVACANVAMLILARTATRSGELAVRTALGASRARIVTQLFMESLVFAVLAAGLGLLLADAIAPRFDWMEALLPFWVELGVTRHTVLWALTLAVFSAGAVSVVPALKVTGKAVHQNMQRAGARRSGMRFGGMSSALVVADVILAVATVGLSVGLWDGFADARDETAIPTGQFLSAAVWIPRIAPAADTAAIDQGEQARRMGDTQRELVRRLAAEPGVRGVALGTLLPGMDHPSRRFEIDGTSQASDLTDPRAMNASVDLNFFAALDQPILAGRGFNLSDLDEGSAVVIANTTFVDQMLGGRNPIGRRVRYRTSDGEEPGPWYEIVGVVGSLGMNEALPGMDAGLYHPLAPGEAYPLRIAIQVGADPALFTLRLRALAHEVDPAVLIGQAVPLDEVFSFNTFTMDWIKIGAGTLIAILLGLSVSGIYALMSFTVAQRTRELGIRSALGAQKNRIVFTIARRAFAQLGIGVLLGMPIAGRLLYELRGVDRTPVNSPLVVMLLVGVSVMAVIGILACTAPTLRALKIMPTEALREGG